MFALLMRGFKASEIGTPKGCVWGIVWVSFGVSLGTTGQKIRTFVEYRFGISPIVLQCFATSLYQGPLQHSAVM